MTRRRDSRSPTRTSPRRPTHCGLPAPTPYRPAGPSRRGCHRGSGDLPVTQPRRRFTRVRPTRLSLARVHPDGFGLPLGFTRLLPHHSLPDACAGREPTWTLIRIVGIQPTTTLQERLCASH